MHGLNLGLEGEVHEDIQKVVNELEENSIFFKLNKVRNEAIMVEVAVPGQWWEIEFLEDDTVDIEKFIR